MSVTPHHQTAKVTHVDGDGRTGTAAILPHCSTVYSFSETNRIRIKLLDNTELDTPSTYTGTLKPGNMIGITRSGWAPLHEIIYLQVFYCGEFYRVRRNNDNVVLCILARVDGCFYSIKGVLPRLQLNQLQDVTIETSADYRFPIKSTSSAQNLFREIWSQVFSSPPYVKLPLRITVA